MALKYHRPDNNRLAVMLTQGTEIAIETRAGIDPTVPKPIAKTDTPRSALGIGSIANRRIRVISAAPKAQILARLTELS